MSRIFCAGGWYTGDSWTPEATRKGLALQFGGGPVPQDWYGVLDAVSRGGSIQFRVSAWSSASRTCPSDRQARRAEGPPRMWSIRTETSHDPGARRN